MTAQAIPRLYGIPWPLPAVTLAMIFLAAALSVYTLAGVQPPALWWSSLLDPGLDVHALIFSDVALPRIVASVLVGAGLALAGLLLQQTLQNPIADTATVGISAGAYLALVIASLWMPSFLNDHTEAVVLAGSAVAAVLVLAVANGWDFSPVSVVTGGLTFSLFFGAVGGLLTVLNHDYLSTLSIWQSGILVQNGWGTIGFLVPRIALCLVVAVLLQRPLSMLALGASHAQSAGLNVSATRLAGLLVAVALGSFCVSAVGVIGFVGLAAPQIVAMLGARTLGERLFWAPVSGALLLWLADQCVQLLGYRQEIPTGVATALAGSLFLLAVVFRLRLRDAPFTQLTPAVQARTKRPAVWGAVLALLLVSSVVLGLEFGKTPSGWEWLSADMAGSVLPWRAPRVIAAACAGSMLAVAGVLLQRLTGNPMASPEVLGISSGGAFGVILLLLFIPGFSDQLALVACAIGALVTLLVLFALAWRSSFSSGRLLLVGISLATLMSAFAGILLTSGDPRAAILLTWMSGSTYRVTTSTACAVAAIAVLAIPASCLLGRWLALVSLGGDIARSAGMNLLRGRLAILATVAVLTGPATIVIGPLSFAGLMTPHIVRALGIRRPVEEILAAAAIGSVLLVSADWLGRNIVYPWQIPAGLIATLIGSPFLLWLMRRRIVP